MHILIAGGAGFIGSHVTRRLVQEGHDVICLDNLLTGCLDNLASVKEAPNFSFVTADVQSCPDFDVDLILHLASPASPFQYRNHALATLAANSLGTLRLLDLALAHGARFLFASTSEVYGEPQSHPQVESDWGYVNSVGERFCYDEGKRFGEAAVIAHHRRYGTNATIVRIFNTYGPNMAADDGRVMPNFILSALQGKPITIFGDGSQTRSFCYVDDLVDALLLVAFVPDTPGEVFNIGNPQEVTVLELARMVLAATSAPEGRLDYVAMSPDDPSRRCPDISKLQACFGWRPTVNLEQGLSRTVAYYRHRLDAPAIGKIPGDSIP